MVTQNPLGTQKPLSKQRCERKRLAADEAGVVRANLVEACE